jgi:hemerythrin
MAIDFQWDKKFAIGQLRIDYEHQMFLELMRNVSLAAEQGEPKEWLVRLLREVRKYADFHFYSEENAMLKMGYPDYATHQQQHSEIVEMLDGRITAYINDQIDIDAVIVFMLDGFALHSTHSDKKLAKYLAKKPV